MSIPVEQFSKDHWSLFAYVASCWAAGNPLDRTRLRVQPRLHPLLAHRSGWEPEWGTRLKDGTQLPDHDDWDCMYDLEDAGLIRVESAVNGIVTMTEHGDVIAAQIQRYKHDGGQFKEFAPLLEQTA